MSGEESRRERKTRSDKKRDVQPTIPVELKDCIYRLSYIASTPVKDVSENICISGMLDSDVMEYLSRNFRRDIKIGNTVYMGDINRESVRKRYIRGRNERISIRFKQNAHENLSALAYAMDCSVARACGLLLDASVRNVVFIGEFTRQYIGKHVDKERMRELKKVLKYINADNPYSETMSLRVFVSYLSGEIRYTTEKLQESVGDILIADWRENR